MGQREANLLLQSIRNATGCDVVVQEYTTHDSWTHPLTGETTEWDVLTKVEVKLAKYQGEVIETTRDVDGNPLYGRWEPLNGNDAAGRETVVISRDGNGNETRWVRLDAPATEPPTDAVFSDTTLEAALMQLAKAVGIGG